MRRLTMVATAAAAVMLALAGCGGPESGNDSDGGGAAYAPEGAAEAAGGVADEAAAGDAETSDRDGLITQAVQEAAVRDIVYTVDLSIETRHVPKAARQAAAIAVAAGGFVADEYTSDDSNSTLTLKVPAAAHTDAVAKLEELGNVINRSRTSQDVTQQVVDTESRIASQKASIERIRSLLAQATGIGEIISIESELASREADLDALLSQQKELSALTSMATVTVSFHAPGEEVADATDLGFLTGLEDGWDAFTGTVSVTLTVLGAMLPFLVAGAVVGVPLWLAVRRRRTAAPAPETTG